MSKVKILITIEGGILQSVGSNVDIEYILVDYDNIISDLLDENYKPLEIYNQDLSAEYFSENFTSAEREAKELDAFVFSELTRLKF